MSSRPSSPFPDDVPWDDMPDVVPGRRARRISSHFRLAIAFLAGAIVGQFLLFLYVWFLLGFAA